MESPAAETPPPTPLRPAPEQVPPPRPRLPIRPGDITLEPGYVIEPLVTGLNFPTDLTFDDQGTLYVAEGGYSYGDAFGPERGRILRVDDTGALTEVAEGFRVPVTSITWHQGAFYVAEGGFPGRITRLAPDSTRQVLIEGLRSGADHFTSEVAFGPNGKMYFAVGSATNSGVVGIDNYYVFNWLPRMPEFHDVPARDITLRGLNFASPNPFLTDPLDDIAVTGAYHPFGVPSRPGEVIEGQLLANSVLYEADADGGNLRVFLDGIRNVFGVGFAPDGRLFFTELGFDVRGSRPIVGLEAMWEGVEGGWYGFPDYSAGIPVTQPRFRPEGAPQPDFLLAEHPPLATQPVAVFRHGASPMKFDFSTSKTFGFVGWAFVPLFGHFDLDEPNGYRVVRINVDTGESRDFLVINRPSLESTGPIHPLEVLFSPDGETMYLLDFGGLFAFGGMVIPTAASGIIWRIRRA